jgi:CDP-diacylglycerol pyrophosphatase
MNPRLFDELTNANGCGKDTDSDGLWRTIQQEVADCQNKGNCDLRKIYPKDGYAEKGNSPNLLMVATDRITGIECPRLWANQTPHYWDLAWQVAKDLPAAAQDKVGMAMNARWDHEKKRIRDYDQLHIHVSCIRTGVQKYLDEHDSQITTTPGNWKDSKLTIGGDLYRVLRLDSADDLAQQNLFESLFYDVLKKEYGGNETKAAQNMPYQTLVVAKRPKGGFYILSSQSNMPNGTGAGEKELLNETCS